MRFSVIGYGQMGKMIHEIAENRGHELVSIIDPWIDEYYSEITHENVKDADVCIEFTAPGSAVSNYRKLLLYDKNIVTGTTGWIDEIEKVKRCVKNSNTGFVYGSNFSLGMNIYFNILEKCSEIFNRFDSYDVCGLEMHHNKKQDSPSGTAKSIANIITNNIERKEKQVFDIVDRKIEKNELHFASVRCGSISGTHSIMFDSEADTLEFKHTARNRRGFALGAVLCSEYISDKKGFYSVEQVFDTIINK